MMRTLILTSICSTMLVMTGCSHRGYETEPPVVEESYIHRYGMEVTPDHWNASGQAGHVISTLQNGVVVDRYYVDGKLDGDTSYTFPHRTQLEKVETYSQGELVKVTNFYVSGTPKEEVQFTATGKTFTTWYETGFPKSHEEYQNDYLVKGEYYDANHNLESSIVDGMGNAYRRDPYGQMISIDSIANGQIVQKNVYHANGSPHQIISYQNGVPHGLARIYMPGGEPNRHEEWSNGELHGMSVIYENGEKFAEIPYQNGVKHGIETRYRDGKDVVEQISWQNDKRHGASVSYVGGVPKTEWYFRGDKVSKPAYDIYSLTYPN